MSTGHKIRVGRNVHVVAGKVVAKHVAKDAAAKARQRVGASKRVRVVRGKRP